MHLDLAAFLQEDRRDITTIAVVARTFNELPRQNPFVETARYLAPNLQLAVTPSKIQWWVPTRPQAPIRETALTEIDRDFVEYRVIPDEMRQARQAGFQTSLFSLLPNALEVAKDATSRVVIERFNSALQAVIKQNGVSKLAAAGLDLLASLILDDKRQEIGLYPYEEGAEDARAALHRAKTHFPLSFRDTSNVSDDILEIFWQYLRTDMSYRSMTPEDLSDLLSALYEGVLLTKSQRKFQGSYYTPKELARRVLEHMPIEEIKPDERVVLDGACGSGNLLRAAGDRLKQLMPASAKSGERASYLSQHLIGIDRDKFAVGIARKALLLANLPHDQDWTVTASDFLTTEISVKPSIIIANPPFKGQRSRGGGELAIPFLTKFLELLKPGGLMGIFLPAPLLQNPGQVQLRSELLKHCAILETWLLPEKSIPSSNLGIAVLILKKHKSEGSKSESLTRAYVAYDIPTKDAFARGSAVSLAFTTAFGQNGTEKARLVPSSLSRVWRRLANSHATLEQAGFDVMNGIQGSPDHFSDNAKPGWRKCLSIVSEFEPYYFDWETQPKGRYVNYPGDLKRPRKSEHFSIPEKGIIQGTRNPKNPWRLIAAIDDQQLVVKENFHYVIPNEKYTGIPMSVVVALLNSTFANIWYSEQDVQFNVQNDLIEQLPFPNLTKGQLNLLERLAIEATALKKSYRVGDTQQSITLKRIRDILLEIDEIIFQAYRLTQEEIEAINQLMLRSRRPGIEWGDSEVAPVVTTRLSPEEAIYYVAGQVLQVDATDNSLTIYLPGLSRLPIKTTIPPSVPGWALQAGVAFEAQIPKSQSQRLSGLADNFLADNVVRVEKLDLYNLVPSRTAYMNDTELVTYVADHSKRT